MVHKHVVGIIPVNSQPMDFNLCVPDCMVPIAPNYLAIENAVYQCALAGVRTIWIVCPLSIQKLLRYRIGEKIQDPYHFNNAAKFHTLHHIEIPIYYVPVSPKDKDRRDSIAWNILYGCHVVNKVTANISDRLKPDKYYICFPNSVCCLDNDFEKNRKFINGPDRFFLSYQNKTIIDGLPISFTVTLNEVKNFIKVFREKATGQFIGKERISIEERYSGRFLELKDIFFDFPESKTNIIEVPWFYAVDTFEGLCQYLGSEHRKTVVRPPKEIMKYDQWRGIANEF